MRPQLSSLTLLTTLFSVAHAQSNTTNPSLTQNLNPTGAGCVDPAGYLACYQKGITSATACAAVAEAQCGPFAGNIDICLQGCLAAQLASNIGCWLQSCWNEVS